MAVMFTVSGKSHLISFIPSSIITILSEGSISFKRAFNRVVLPQPVSPEIIMFFLERTKERKSRSVFVFIIPFSFKSARRGEKIVWNLRERLGALTDGGINISHLALMPFTIRVDETKGCSYENEDDDKNESRAPRQYKDEGEIVVLISLTDISENVTKVLLSGFI